jgi:hypothetical protein
MLCAWARRKSDQLGPIRRGAGPRPETRNTVATVVAETADSELQQLALDAHRGPVRVLPRQPEAQAARRGRKRRTTGPTAALAAVALQQPPVPAAECLRADRKARPPLDRKQPARRNEQRTISGRVPRPPSSAPQDRHLVAQNHDFEVALTAAAGEQTNENAEEPVEQAGQQDAQSEPLRPRSSPPPHRRIEFLYPTGITGSFGRGSSRRRPS